MMVGAPACARKRFTRTHVTRAYAGTYMQAQTFVITKMQAVSCTHNTHTHTHREKSQLAAVTSAIGLQTVLRVQICPLRSVMFFYHQEGETIHIWDRWEWNGYLTLVSGQNSLLFNQSLITSFSIFIIIFNKAIGITHIMEMI